MNTNFNFKRLTFRILLIILLSQFFLTFYFPSILRAESYDNIHNTQNDFNLSKISSKAFLVFDRNSNQVLIHNHGFDKLPMASTTKIMTCLLALEYGNLNDKVTISKNATTIHGSKLKLSSNQNSNITLKDLLYGLMLRSGNDAAIAIAEHISGSYDNFTQLMNKKSKELNLANTHFTSPHGLDNENHYTTAYELAILTDIALENEDFKKIVSTNITSINHNNNLTQIQNTNDLLRKDNNFYGVKTGFTFNARQMLSIRI